MKKVSKIAIAIFAILIGLYPIAYFLIDRKFGLLSTKTTELLSNNLWNMAFYLHITLGGVALLIGWSQFKTNVRSKNIQLHRNIGKTYVISVIISGISSLYIALFATGGIISVLGFFTLGFIWLITTILSFQAIKKGKIDVHQKLMIYSYAACFAAVTLRLWLPFLIMATGEFNSAYQIVAWLCWVPNMMVAYLIARNKKLLSIENPS